MADAKAASAGIVVQGLSKDQLRVLHAALEAYAKSCDRFAAKPGLPDAVLDAYRVDARMSRELYAVVLK